MNIEQSIQKRLVCGIVETMRIKPFYGHIIQQFQKIYVRSPHRISTAAVGRVPGDRFVKLYLNEDFFNWTFDSEIEKAVEGSSDPAGAKKAGYVQGWKYMIGVLEHEILHVALGHIFQDFPDRKRANVAMDCVVNSYIHEDNMHPTGITPERYGFPRYKSTTWYYRELAGNEKYKEDMQKGAFGKGGMFEDAMGSHALWDDIRDDRMAKEFMKDIISKSKDLCKSTGYGKMPGDLMTQIDAWLTVRKPKLSWGHVMRMFCASKISSELSYTMKRESKRFGTRPGTKKGDVLSMAIIIDTSGSMSDHEIRLFWNEIWWAQRNGAEIHVYECDTQVHGPIPYRGKWNGEVHGRGGTSFDEAMEKVEGKYDAAIYFTDGYAPKLVRRYRIPTLWVLTTDLDEEAYPDPHGRYVKIDVRDNNEDAA